MTTTDEARPMSREQRDLARHALGLGRAGNSDGRSYRNRFVTGLGSADHPPWMAMVADGNAIRRDGAALPFGGDDLFHLTRAGAEQALRDGESLDPEDFPSEFPHD